MENIDEKEWSDNNITLELRFNTEKNFFTNQNIIISKFIDIFPQYNPQSMNNIMMHTSEFPGISFSLNPNRFGLTFEIGYSQEDVTRYIKNTYSIIREYLHIEKFNRIGFRVRSIKQFDIEKAKEKLNSHIEINKICNNKDIFLDASSFVVVLNYKSSKIRAAYNVVTAQTNIISNQAIGPINLNLSIETLPQQSSMHGISADIDFYRLNIENVNIDEFIKDAYEGMIECKQLMN